MLREDVEDFLRNCNEGMVQLMHQLHLDQQTMDATSTKLRQRLLATLLESDIITADTFTNATSSTSLEPKKEDDLLERSNQMIKNLVQQLLDKDEEIKLLKAALESEKGTGAAVNSLNG